ncbi:MAG: glycosyltransferase [Spirosomataceae bacterium]
MIALILLYGSYALGCLMAWLTWLWMKTPTVAQNYEPSTKITVVIPVRNEAQTILRLLECIDQQQFPSALIEVIVVNDNSTDDTKEKVEQFVKTARFRGVVLDVMPTEAQTSPKKRAITKAVAQASGELIVTTDGDCWMGPNWLRVIESQLLSTGANMICGPVTFGADGSVFTNLQIVEFASLVGAGAVSLALKLPSMCNGANLAYRKVIFEEVKGFEGSEEVASGDDEFLMHKFFAHNPEKVHFLKSEQAIVFTQALPDWNSFKNQRRRWASKWKKYQNWQVSALAIYIFMVNFGLIISSLMAVFGKINGIDIGLLLALKWIPEWLFLAEVLTFLGHSNKRWWILSTQWVYPFYVTFFGLLAQQKGYEWKGRKLA